MKKLTIIEVGYIIVWGWTLAGLIALLAMALLTSLKLAGMEKRGNIARYMCRDSLCLPGSGKKKHNKPNERQT
jgi:hypothetical protein